MPEHRHADEVEQLQAELRAVKAELARYQRGANLLGRVAAYVSYGPSIQSALTRWEAAYSSSSSKFFWRKVPRNESIALVAAYLRRRALSGLLIAIFASVPAVVTAVLLWQQNRKIDLQIQLTGLSQAGQLQAPLAEIIKDLHSAGDKICLDLANQEVKKVLEAFSVESTIPVNDLRCYRPDLFGKDRLPRARTSSWVELHNRTLLEFSLPAGYSTTFLDRHRDWLKSSSSLPLANLKPEPPLTLLTTAKHFSNTLRPYRTLILPDEPTATPTLSREPVSPERGILLQAFATSKLSPLGVTFERAWTPGAYFPDVYWHNLDLRKAVIECSAITGDLTGAKLTSARAAGVNFLESNLSAMSDAQGADFRFASFESARLPTVSVLRNANVQGADFTGAIAPINQWLSTLTGQPDDEYKYEPFTDSGTELFRMKRAAQSQRQGVQTRESFCESRKAEGYAL